jgi:hypothetical protein
MEFVYFCERSRYRTEAPKPKVSYVTTDGQSASHLKLMTTFLFSIAGFFMWDAAHTTIFHCLIWESPTWSARSPYLHPPPPPQNRVAHLLIRVLGLLFIASYDSKGYGGIILTRLHTGRPEHSAEILLYSLCTNPTEKTVSINSSTGAFVSVAAVTWSGRPGNMFTEP